MPLDLYKSEVEKYSFKHKMLPIRKLRSLELRRELITVFDKSLLSEIFARVYTNNSILKIQC